MVCLNLNTGGGGGGILSLDLVRPGVFKLLVDTGGGGGSILSLDLVRPGAFKLLVDRKPEAPKPLSFSSLPLARVACKCHQQLHPRL